MLVCIVMNVFDKLGRVDDFDVVGEADDETAHAVIVGDKGIEKPMGFVNFEDVVLSEGVFLDEQTVCHHAQAKTDAIAVVAGHAEDIDETFAVGMAVLP